MKCPRPKMPVCRLRQVAEKRYAKVHNPVGVASLARGLAGGGCDPRLVGLFFDSGNCLLGHVVVPWTGRPRPTQWPRALRTVYQHAVRSGASASALALDVPCPSAQKSAYSVFRIDSGHEFFSRELGHFARLGINMLDAVAAEGIYSRSFRDESNTGTIYTGEEAVRRGFAGTRRRRRR